MDNVIKYLEGCVRQADAQLEQFQKDITKKGYGHALEWSLGAFGAAALKDVATQHLDSIRSALESGHPINEVLYVQNVGNKIIRDATRINYSTSPTSNLYAAELKAAEAKIHQYFTRGF